MLLNLLFQNKVVLFVGGLVFIMAFLLLFFWLRSILNVRMDSQHWLGILVGLFAVLLIGIVFYNQTQIQNPINHIYQMNLKASQSKVQDLETKRSQMIRNKQSDTKLHAVNQQIVDEQSLVTKYHKVLSDQNQQPYGFGMAPVVISDR